MKRESHFHLGRYAATALLLTGCANDGSPPSPAQLASNIPSTPVPHATYAPDSVARVDISDIETRITLEGTVFTCHNRCELVPLSAHGGIKISPFYTPSDLVSINHLKNPALSSGLKLSVTRETAGSLEQLIYELRKRDIFVTVNSGYRTPEEQAELYKTQPSLSVPPGRSEHEIGTTIDLQYSLASQQAVMSAAYRYGFVPTTMRDNLGVPPEPWHFRYVGTGILDKYEVWAANQRRNPGQSDSFQIFLSEKTKCSLPNAKKLFPDRCPRRKGGRKKYEG